ncbi:Superoxide dismutase [Cu-Zn] [Gryllus bimaculatus]|nr:Superoxide dismutase [Cu-Zn] [Gryllus bimaculatus]
MATKVEFAVEMTCNNCVDAIKNKLSNAEGIHNYSVSLDEGFVVVETSLPSDYVKQLIESTNRRAVLKGFGDGETSAAVAMLGGTQGASLGPVRGVIRFHQMDNNKCIIDGTLDGLTPGWHGLHVHECGDISQGCESVGSHFNPGNTRHGGPGDEPEHRHAGDLGNIKADNSGRASFRLMDNILKVQDIIGRSIVVTENEDDLGRGDHSASHVDGNSGTRLACGIIARSARLFENTKRICACDGVTLWDEREKPLAGPGRQQQANL